MKKLKYLTSVLLFGFLFTSCDDFLNVNVNPDAPTSVPAENLLPTIVFYSAQINYDHAEYNAYLSQCLTTGGKAQTSGYGYKAGWSFLSMNRHPQWRRHFFDIGKNNLEMAKKAEEKGMSDYIALGRAIMLMSTQLTTDAFGAMPRTEAYTNASSPKYDTQESLYEWMLQECDALIAYFDSEEVRNAYNKGKLTYSQDRIFGGNPNKWKHFVYAMKARILLRNLPNLNTSAGMCDQIIAAADNALAGWEEPLYHFEGGQDQKNCPWGSTQPIINSWESRPNLLTTAIPSKYFMVNMLRYDAAVDRSRLQNSTMTKGRMDTLARADKFTDPRIPYLMLKRRKDADGPAKASTYRFLENNFGMNASDQQIYFPDLYQSKLTDNTSNISLFTTEELHFIKAEAYFWKGNKNEAWNSLEKGIRSHMGRLGVYPTSNTLGWGNIDGYIEQEKTNVGAAKVTLSYIMREKYIAMYLQSEQWTDLRRYGYSNNQNNRMYNNEIIYPGLKRPYNLLESIWNVSDVNDWIQRYNYDPDTEEKYSREQLIALGAFDPATNSGNPKWLKKPMIWAPQN